MISRMYGTTGKCHRSNKSDKKLSATAKVALFYFVYNIFINIIQLQF